STKPLEGSGIRCERPALEADRCGNGVAVAAGLRCGLGGHGTVHRDRLALSGPGSGDASRTAAAIAPDQAAAAVSVKLIGHAAASSHSLHASVCCRAAAAAVKRYAPCIAVGALHAQTAACLQRLVQQAGAGKIQICGLDGAVVHDGCLGGERE